MSFGKAFLASCLGTLVALVALVVIMMFVWAAIVAAIVADADPNSQVTVKSKSILHLKLNGPIVETQVDEAFGPFSVAGDIALVQLIDAIKEAKTDDKIEGIYLDVSMPIAGYATIDEIRTALADFKAHGKWIVAYSEMYSEKAYYLASVADKVLLYKEGDVEFNGLTVEAEFYKKLLDKLEIKPQVFRVGEFKSAVEPFLLEKMSPAAREQTESLINSIYDHVLVNVAESRKIPLEKLTEISDKMLVTNAQQAKDQGLIDGLVYYDEVLDEFKSRLGIDSVDSKGINIIKYSQYKRTVSNYKSSKNEIAVIVAEGEIVNGKGSRGIVGSDVFAQAIRSAREDDDVKAIVVRINSPGGSFSASDIMWREIDLATKEKPVIASMADVAASGGYYMAMACDTIVAQPNTITGSIGIFGVMFDLSGFLGNKLGVTHDEAKTGEFGDRFTVTRPLTEQEKKIWQTEISRLYEVFTSKAAEGRGISQDAIKAIGGGRVWSGSQALENHLVDVLGSFDDAVEIAANKAKLGNDYKLRYYPKPKPVFESLIDEFTGDAETKAMQEKLGDYYGWFMKWEELKTRQGVQARLPYDLMIE